MSRAHALALGLRAQRAQGEAILAASKLSNAKHKQAIAS